MTFKIKPVYLCYYGHSGDSLKSEVTDDEDYAYSLDPHPKIPAIDDLMQNRAANGEVFEGWYIHTIEGIVTWVEDDENPELSRFELVNEKRLAV